MSIAARCLHCAHRFSAPDTLAGKRVKCPKCAGAVPVPQLATPPVDENLLEVLDDNLAVHPAERHLAVAPATPPAPRVIVAKLVKRPGLSQLAPYAPALELIGVFIVGLGLFGLFANLVLKYESTWRDLGIVALLGGGALFVLAQFVEYDGERFGRAIGVLFFVCVISASIGAGIEVANGRMTADSFRFWSSSDPEALSREVVEIADNTLNALSKIHDLQSANLHVDELRAADERMGEWMRKNKDRKIYMTKKKQQELERKFKPIDDARQQKFARQIAIIGSSPNGAKAMRLVVDSIQNTLKRDNVVDEFETIVRRLEVAESQPKPNKSFLNPFLPAELRYPEASATTAQLSATPPLSPSEATPATQPQKTVEQRQQEMADRMAKQIQDARSRFASRNSTSSPSPAATSTSPRPGASSRPPQGRTFREQADWQFKFSRDAAGQAYLQAAAIAGSDEALKPQLQWCPALKRPAFSLFWGIGVSLEAMSEAPPPDDRWKNVRRPLEERRQDVGFWQVNEFKKRTGDIGEWLAQGIQSRLDQRQFGDWGPEWERSKFDLRGLVLFEAGPLGWSLQKAREEGIDVLLMLHLHDKKSAAGAYTELQINVLRVSDGKSLWHSDVLSDRKLKNERRKGKDPAADLVAAAFTFIDKELRLTSMPTVKPDAARKRAAKVCADRGIEPMTAVIEVRYYQVQGLLTADEARELYEKKVGPAAAEALATGEESDREKALATFFGK